MTIYATGNPVGSTNPKDLKDNAQNLDWLILGPAASYPDRLGVNRLSWAGIEAAFAAAQAARSSEYAADKSYRDATYTADKAYRDTTFSADQAYRVTQFNAFLASSGYETPVDYVAGISVTRSTQILKYLGELYRPKVASLPFTTTVWATDAAKLIANGDNSLRQDMANIVADPSKGSALVGYKRAALADTIKTVGQMLSVQAYNVWEYANLITGKPTTDPATWDWAPAIVAAWNATPIGGSLVIPMGVHIGSAVTLTDKAVNLFCMGPITVADGNFTALYFDGTANVTEYPGTILTGITASDTKLSFVPGMAPALNPTDYYLVIYSLEANVNRVNETYYIPYSKRETHGLSHYDWSLHDPILYTYADLSGVTLRFIKKADRTKIVGLTLQADASTNRSARDLLRTRCKSCVDFEGLHINSALANRAGFGFEIYECFDFVLNSPRVSGYNVSGVDSYKIRSFMSAHLVFNNYIDATDADPVSPNTKTERAYASMYSNMITFNNCFLNGIDEHYGSRYVINGGSLSHRGIGFAGRDVTINGTKFTGPGVLFQPRDDSPSCHGTLRINNVEIDAVSQLILGETGIITDPLGRTTPFKMFDRILVDGVVVKGGLQSWENIISFRGIRNATTFTSSKTTLIDVRNLKVYSERTNVNHSVMQFASIWVDTVNAENWEIADSAVAYRGDIRYLGPAYDALNIGELKLSNSRATVYGIRNTAKFTMRGGSLAGSGESLLVEGGFGAVAVSLKGVELNKPLAESVPVAGVNPTWDIVECTINVAPSNLTGRIARGLRNSIALGVTIPGALVGKLRVYEDATLFAPTTILATGSWTIPAIASGASASNTFTVTGAAFGDQIDVSVFSGALVVSAQITSANTVTVVIANNSGASVTLGAQTLRFTVRKI
jgi:hypothetical protein